MGLRLCSFSVWSGPEIWADQPHCVTWNHGGTQKWVFAAEVYEYGAWADTETEECFFFFCNVPSRRYLDALLMMGHSKCKPTWHHHLYNFIMIILPCCHSRPLLQILLLSSFFPFLFLTSWARIRVSTERIGSSGSWFNAICGIQGVGGELQGNACMCECLCVCVGGWVCVWVCRVVHACVGVRGAVDKSILPRELQCGIAAPRFVEQRKRVPVSLYVDGIIHPHSLTLRPSPPCIFFCSFPSWTTFLQCIVCTTIPSIYPSIHPSNPSMHSFLLSLLRSPPLSFRHRGQSIAPRSLTDARAWRVR